MKDPLDQKIDELLASRPLRADVDFRARVLQAVAEEEAPRPRRTGPGTLLKFALPLAAAIAVVTILLNQSSEPTTHSGAASLSTVEAEEILRLESGLQGLARLESSEVAADGLLDTFEILYLEI
ncbi:MAG: hypothetical protein GVY36_13035 [Verrucomicrobia bacterium]|jgi:hypothetical protein|nr:hypothetical protein [Verrucomicrobiota bacterium]